MRVETIYYADDDTEFCTEEACLAYEASLKANFDSVIFFDDAFNRLEEFCESTFESVWYIKVLDGEKATKMMEWQYSCFGVCMDGLPDELHDGEIYAWDDESGEWYDPEILAKKYTAIVDAIREAVAKL